MEQYVSVSLLNELPLPLINFLWYLWEAYCDAQAVESVMLLRQGNKSQCVTIVPASKTVEQDFGKSINAIVIIRKDGIKYYMSRQ